MQEQHSNKLEEVIKIHVVAGKLLLNLETKFARVESANDKLVDAYDQSEDTEGVELFQQTLDEDAEVMDNVVSRISELKIMKEELERGHSQLEAQVACSETTQSNPIDTPGVNLASIWSQSTLGAIRPPKLEITPFVGDIMK